MTKPPDGALAMPAVEVPLTWSERWFALRNRILASPVFQRRAAAFVLTRPIVLVGYALIYVAAALTLWSMVLYVRAAWPALRLGVERPL